LEKCFSFPITINKRFALEKPTLIRCSSLANPNANGYLLPESKYAVILENRNASKMENSDA